MSASPIAKRSIVIADQKTSVSLEAPFWSALKEIAAQRASSLSRLVAEVDRTRQEANHANLSSALRLFVLDYYRTRGSSADIGEDPDRPERGLSAR